MFLYDAYIIYCNLLRFLAALCKYFLCIYLKSFRLLKKVVHPRPLIMKLVIKLFLMNFSCYYFYWMDNYGFLLLLTNIFLI